MDSPFTKEFQVLINQLPVAARALWDLAIGSIDSISDIVYGDDPKGIWNQKPYLNSLIALPDGAS